jgi:hypothetical protein
MKASCGPIGDGCGGTLNCGTCKAPETCGGGGVLFQCGGNSGCVPMTQVQACGTYDCGELSDGCGGTLNCGPNNGMCPGGQTCGGGGPFHCGTGGVCTPLTMAAACTGKSPCGTVADGCGGTVNCGSCTAPETCGGGGVDGQCGSPTCTPLTCAEAKATCGYVGDGCGGIIGGAMGPGCGTCPMGEICGGSGSPNNCGSTCTNLCTHQPKCDAGSTTFTGTVTAPGHVSDVANWGNPDPIPGAIVYVPNGTVQAFTPGVSCGTCSAEVTGDPLVTTTSATDGTFTLSNVPCGVDVPLVIQLGRWRRQVTIPSPTCCTNTALTNDQTRLPRNQSEGDIPKIAVVTGSADPMECILPKIGIDAGSVSGSAYNEYTDPTGTGRINFYRASSAGSGASLDLKTPTDAALWGSLSTMENYDLIIIDCEGDAYNKTAYYSNLISYTSAGGRIYTSHYGYSFLHGENQMAPPALNTTWDATATWDVSQPQPPDQTATIDQSFAEGKIFATWLNNVTGVALGSVPVDYVCNDLDAVVAPSQRWIYGTTNGKPGGTVVPLHYTFDTPVGALPANQCGRVMYSDFHVNTSGSGTGTFPGECSFGKGVQMTDQEKVLEFMIFNLTSCLNGTNPGCTPGTCASEGFTCGMQGDGCGNVLNCGSCTSPQICGGGGSPGVCGGGCTPTTCAALGYSCGQTGDGCGNLINCGTCTPPEMCGGGGPNKCGNNTCTPTTCAAQKLQCGQTGDGCGNILNCGTCKAPQTCGGGGTPGVCGAPSCTPRTCASANANCGTIGDGCGNVLNCGTCPSGQLCGALGRANQCGSVG